jgi:hypothetical protein
LPGTAQVSLSERRLLDRPPQKKETDEMKLKTLFVALVAVCIAIALAAAQPSAAGPGKGQGKAKANAAVVKKGHDKTNGHQNSGGHKAGKGHSEEAGAEEAAPEQPTTEDSNGAGGAEADVAVEEEAEERRPRVQVRA